MTRPICDSKIEIIGRLSFDLVILIVCGHFSACLTCAILSINRNAVPLFQKLPNFIAFDSRAAALIVNIFPLNIAFQLQLLFGVYAGEVVGRSDDVRYCRLSVDIVELCHFEIAFVDLALHSFKIYNKMRAGTKRMFR